MVEPGELSKEYRFENNTYDKLTTSRINDLIIEKKYQEWKIILCTVCKQVPAKPYECRECGDLTCEECKIRAT